VIGDLGSGGDLGSSNVRLDFNGLRLGAEGKPNCDRRGMDDERPLHAFPSYTPTQQDSSARKSTEPMPALSA